jgi:hypothetical protein
MELDFLEIGTSDFSTEIQVCSSSAVGISVDPLQYYLDRLPEKPLVTKVCCAISDEDGETEIYHVSENNITKHNLPYWVRGCNSIGHPHPTVAKLLQERKLSVDIISVQVIPKLSVFTFLKKYNISKIHYLKVDTEGHDCVIMKAFANEIRSKRFPPPKRICFETNVLSSSHDQKEVINIFCQEFNYKIISLGVDAILEQ